MAGQEAPLILGPDSPALRLIQRVRDEAHRFAIAGHRKARARSRLESLLEEIPGLGPAKRRELLQVVRRAAGRAAGLGGGPAKVRGIRRPLAELIYEKMNPGP